MEYTIKSFAELSGLSTRTLRYYDEIGLLRPCRISSSGYRLYGTREADLLQQILIYRELGLPLEEIKKIISGNNFDFRAALNKHRLRIIEKRERLNRILDTIEKTLLSMEGEIVMSDKEKFEGFKQKLLRENEEKYGKEIREKYSEEVIEESNRRFMGLSAEDWKKYERVNLRFAELLNKAMNSGDPASEVSMEMVAAHRETIGFFGEYPKEAYLGLTQMYNDDERFRAYYDNIRKGSAKFLRAAAEIFAARRM